MDPDTDLLESDPFDWLDIDDMPDTDLFSEKHDASGVGSRLGEDEVEVWEVVLASSSSAGIADGCVNVRGSLMVTLCSWLKVIRYSEEH